MSTTTSHTRALRLTAVAAATLLTALTATGCSYVAKYTADAYSITYRVTVEGDDIDTISAVEYGESPNRGEETAAVDAGGLVTKNDSADAHTASWQTEALVTATEEAWVTATPGAGAVATCSILIDGEREIDTATAGMGETVECRATTPAFGD